MTAASVLIGACDAASVDATASMPAAGANGSSPCRLTTMVSSSQPAMSAHSASRSVPEAWVVAVSATCTPLPASARRSEEHTSELQSLIRISYADFVLQKKTTLHIPHK